MHYIGGQRWTIYLASPNSKHLVSENGDRLNGHCFYDACRIYINRDLNEGALYDTLLHELLHAWLRVSAADTVYNQDGELDEKLVSALTPIMHRSLSDLGFKFPKFL